MFNDLPANQIALANTFRAIAKGRPKPLKAHLADAEEAMLALRSLGFRVVPFPPLKSRNGVHKKTRGRPRKAA